MNELEYRLKNLSSGIANYVNGYLNSNKGFASRTFYAETFALSLLARHGLLGADNERLLLDSFGLKNKKDPQFHHEFNNYAFVDTASYSNKSFESFFMPLVFKGTECTNWTLLREFVVNKVSGNHLDNVFKKIHNAQDDSGLISDDPGVHSFQYHCFSATLLLELYLLSKDDRLKTCFLKAVSFIKNFILPNGDTLYIGRGQEQSFGYGALIYMLAGHYELTGDTQSLSEIELILKYLQKFVNSNGSFPLVMNEEENCSGKDVNLKDPAFKGWYAYNNYFDYLCFLGVYLDKAREVIARNKIPEEWLGKVNLSYRDENFRKFATVKYVAVWAKPGGYWTNDLTFPLICYKKKIQTPCLGGEQFVEALYSEQELSFPQLDNIKTKWSWRKLGFSKWIGNTLLWISPWGIWKKTLIIREDSITIKTRLWTPFKASDYITLDTNTKLINPTTLHTNDLKITSNSPFEFIKDGVCAKGFTKTYRVENKTITLKIELL